MNSVKKFIKLLCFVFITFFVIGFGGEKVSAVAAPDEILVSHSSEYWGGHSFIKKTTIGDKTYYVFCLDSNKSISKDSLELKNDLHSDKKEAVSRIYFRALQLGLGDGNSSHTFTIGGKNYTVSESDLYGITQSAIWYAVHGTSSDGGYSFNYSNWVKTKGYVSIYDELVKASSNPIQAPYVRFENSGPSTEVTIDNVVYRVNTYTITPISNSVPNSVRYTATMDNCEIKVNDGEWTSSEVNNLKNGDVVSIRVVKPTVGSGTVKSSVRVESNEFVYDTDAYFYKANGIIYQNMGLIIPKVKTTSFGLSSTYNYENNTNVSIQKLDSSTNTKVAGAFIDVYDKNNTLLSRVLSTGANEDNPTISLVDDTGYYIKEVSAPNGYKLDETPVYFDVVNGQVQQNGQVVDSATVSIKDQKFKMKFRKVDENGNPMSGVEIRLENYVSRNAHNPNYLVVCAITDENGYLTRPCNIPNADRYYSADGEYDYDDFIIFDVIESNAPKGYYTPSFNDSSVVHDFGLDDSGRVVIMSPNITLQGTPGIDSTLVFTFHNQRYIDISKTDLGGTELPGAQMKLYDGENKDYYVVSGQENAEEIAPYVLLDSWTSGNEPHRFSGIIPGHKYILTEEVAPTGYVKITTNIEFKMDADGKVTVLSQDASTNDSAYKLTVMNDYTKVTFSKSSATTGAEVPGAHLKICTLDAYNQAAADKNDGNECTALEEWDSTSKPHEVNMLPTGKYVLIETLAPVGYVKQTNAVEFEVKDSKILAVEMINEPTKVTISKKDVTTGEELPGAHLKICTLISYENDGMNCKPDDDAWSWVSTDQPNKIEALPFGEYVLIETLPTPEYEEGMIIEGNVVTAYNFTISQDNNNIKIDVYNKLLTRVPNTGISTLNLFAIGGLLVFVGYETIKIYRRRNNA